VAVAERTVDQAVLVVQVAAVMRELREQLTDQTELLTREAAVAVLQLVQVVVEFPAAQERQELS
jgi:hypothetical protein